MHKYRNFLGSDYVPPPNPSIDQAIEVLHKFYTGISAQELLDTIYSTTTGVNEPLAVDAYYDEMGFTTETSRDYDPPYDWRLLLSQQLRLNGLVNPEVDSQRWENLHQSMREQVTLYHYLQTIHEYASANDPESWNYITAQSEGFAVTRNSNFAEVHEGSKFIGINVSVLMADIKSGDEKRLAGALARLVHESRHIELNKLIGLTPEELAAKGVDVVLGQKSYEGYMRREEDCWQMEVRLYTQLTGEPPPRRWEDEDVQAAYRSDYSKWK